MVSDLDCTSYTNFSFPFNEWDIACFRLRTVLLDDIFPSYHAPLVAVVVIKSLLYARSPPPFLIQHTVHLDITHNHPPPASATRSTPILSPHGELHFLTGFWRYDWASCFFSVYFGGLVTTVISCICELCVVLFIFWIVRRFCHLLYCASFLSPSGLCYQRYSQTYILSYFYNYLCFPML